MEIAPGTILNNRYRIIRKLGAGGMGAVYLAFDSSLDTEVAVKCNRNASKESTTQFIREARLLASLRHTNLPRVSDYFIVEQNQYLVMDYIPGDDLGTLLQKDGPQPWEKVVKWVDQLCSALNYLHNQNPPVIHRDIKPANLKLMENGDVMLVDFGIAKAAETSQATATGAIGYTPGYAPPEQYGGSHTGPFSDMYSLGATLYNLLTNQKPADAVQRVLEQAALVPLRTLAPHVPPHVEAAIHQAMALRSEDRFANMAAFNKALHNPHFQETITRSEPLSAVAADGAAQTTPAAGPYPPPHPIFNVHPTTPQPAPPHVGYQDTRPVYAPVRKRRRAGWIIAVLIGLLGLGAVTAAAGIYFLFLRSGEKGSVASITATSHEQPTIAAAAQAREPAPLISATMPPPTTGAINATPSAETVTPASELRMIANGKLLAFVSDRGVNGVRQVYTMKVGLNSNGIPTAMDITQVTSDEGDKGQPAWSPDGHKLLYTAPGPEGNGLDVYLMDLESESSPINISQFKGDDTDPAWSPDGRKIAFVNQGRFTDVRQVYMSNPDGSDRQRLSLDFEEYSPAWSPDMEWLFYVVFARDHNYFWYRNKVAAYATPQVYDPSSHFGRLGEVDDPVFSPDGEQVAYVRAEGTWKRIYSLEFRSRGGKTTPLTAANQLNYSPSWSPDGQYIAFVSERGGNKDIYIMTSNGQLQTNLSPSPGSDIDPAWQK